MQKTEVNKINSAVSYFNSAVEKFNNYSKLLNKKNSGKKISYSQLSTLLTNSEKDAKKAKEIYLKVKTDNKNIIRTKNQSLKDIEKMLNTINKQKSNIKRYK